MLLTPHAATGAAIGAVVRAPILAVPLAVASHFALDAVPHWQETLAPYRPHRGTWIRLPFDLAGAAVCVAAVASRRPKQRTSVWIGAAAALVPDIDSLTPLLSHRALASYLPAHYLRWHAGIQRETASPLGLLPQAAVTATALAVVRRGAERQTRP